MLFKGIKANAESGGRKYPAGLVINSSPMNEPGPAVRSLRPGHGEMVAVIQVCPSSASSAATNAAEPCVLSGTVADRHFGSGSWLESNGRQIGSPGRQPTQTVYSGTVQWKSPNLSALGQLSADWPAGLSVDLYNALAGAVW